MDVYSVSTVTRYLKGLLEIDSNLQSLWVQGEISNFVVSSAGHAYFTLKDANSQLRCVLFRRDYMQQRRVRPANGMAIIAHGRLTVYEAQGVYQLVVDLVQPEGVGALHLQYELLRSRLEQEGLFDPARKRALPRFPRRIGVVTSPTGAVLQDIINVLRRRYPFGELVLSPTLVQGDEAAQRICAAIKALGDYGAVDVIIVARGGGSLEELWPFNDESVARAIYAAPVPVVSGVGHETDSTIADLVADLRAPTPSAAAELVAPDWRECFGRVADWERQLATLAVGHCRARRQKVQRAAATVLRHSPQALIDGRRQRTDDLALRGHVALDRMLALWQAKVEGRALQLRSLDPLAVLGRGYSICRLGDRVISRVSQVVEGDEVAVQVSDGRFDATVKG